MGKTYCDMACDILHMTKDGDELAPVDLKLLELAVNGYLSEKGEVAFAGLHARVMAGDYSPPWLQGVEHLTRNHQGYVFWKGIEVEHFSFTDAEREKAAAEDLAGKCRALEARGEVVNISSVLG